MQPLGASVVTSRNVGIFSLLPQSCWADPTGQRVCSTVAGTQQVLRKWQPGVVGFPSPSRQNSDRRTQIIVSLLDGILTLTS